VGLSRDSISAESVSYGDNGDPYRFEYYNYFDMAAAMRGGAKKVLVVGGGTFSYPRFYVAAHPTSTVDVVEIDPALYGIAKKDFGYTDDPRIKLSFEDGRTFLNHASGTYDMIIVDAFKSKATVPYQLTTQETWKHCYDLLAPNGVLVMNVIASPTDSRKQFFDSLYATIESVFPHVAAFHVQDDGEGGLRNTSIIASKDPNADISAAVAKLSPTASAKEYKNYQVPASTKLLTDDFAPVDQYLLGL
jgi:spermidine synthase